MFWPGVMMWVDWVRGGSSLYDAPVLMSILLVLLLYWHVNYRLGAGVRIIKMKVGMGHT